MTTLIEKLLRNYSSCYVTDGELETLLKISKIQRYGQVKRALHKGDLVRVRRGLYCVGQNLTAIKPHPLELAQKIYWPSFISLETALAYHGLIPEAVYITTSATPKRHRVFTNIYGTFSYAKLPETNFFLQVERKCENNIYYYMAQPWRAICDYIYCRKKNWYSLKPLEDALRIDAADLPPLTSQAFTELLNYYHNSRITNFLTGVKRAL